MKNKKAQMEPTQIFLFILAAIIAAGVLLFGYTYIQKMVKQGNDIDIQKFKTTLANEVTELSTDYGTVRKLALDVPSGFTEVCFVSSSRLGDSNLAPSRPIIEDSIASNQLKNVFLYPDGKTSFYIGNINVTDDFQCYSKSGGQVVLKLKGVGKKVEISQWS